MNPLRQRRYNGRRPLAEMNVVPYIDVMLVLLVIFMITAPLLNQGIQVNLPKAQAKTIQSSEQLPVIVSVDASGRYFLNLSEHPTAPINGQTLMTDVAARLTLAAQQHQTLPVYVKGDKDVNYGQVVQAMALLQTAGAQHIGLMTQR